MVTFLLPRNKAAWVPNSQVGNRPVCTGDFPYIALACLCQQANQWHPIPCVDLGILALSVMQMDYIMSQFKNTEEMTKVSNKNEKHAAEE